MSSGDRPSRPEETRSEALPAAALAAVPARSGAKRRKVQRSSAGHETAPGAATTLTLPGLNIQWPFSQLVLAGAKSEEVREYCLGHRGIQFAGTETFLVETRGPTAAASRDAHIGEALIGPRPTGPQIVGTVTFSHSEAYPDRAAFSADAWSHRIRDDGAKAWDGSGRRFKWHVDSVRRFAEPISCKTGQTGWHAPRSFEVVLVGGDGAASPRGAVEVPAGAVPAKPGRREDDRPSRRDRNRLPGVGPRHRRGARWRRKASEQSGGQGGAPADAQADLPSFAALQSDVYFEEQRGAWCGMHALNNYLGGPYVTAEACERAARQVVFSLSQAGAGDAEAYGQHLCPETGFLSIDVINVIGAANLGFHVEGNAVSWRTLQTEPESAALLNWNNRPAARRGSIATISAVARG